MEASALGLGLAAWALVPVVCPVGVGLLAYTVGRESLEFSCSWPWCPLFLGCWYASVGSSSVRAAWFIRIRWSSMSWINRFLSCEDGNWSLRSCRVRLSSCRGLCDQTSSGSLKLRQILLPLVSETRRHRTWVWGLTVINALWFSEHTIRPV